MPTSDSVDSLALISELSSVADVDKSITKSSVDVFTVVFTVFHNPVPALKILEPVAVVVEATVLLEFWQLTIIDPLSTPEL
jgi:uncharacterized protein (DUF2344 family)